MFPRVTHPSAADVLLRPLDLHVLSLPPAFALSQDQTLKLDLNFEPADHNVLTRSHHFPPTEVDELPAIHIAGNDGVTLKRVPPKSFVRPRSEKPKLFKCETRKDSAVHVSLSSSSLVKQPGTSEAPSFQRGRVPTPLPTMNELQSTYVDCCVTQQSEEHQWHGRSPWSLTRRRRAQWSGYKPPRSGLSTTIVNKTSHGGFFEKIVRFQVVRRASIGRAGGAR
jgi:hypothetical protein